MYCLDSKLYGHGRWPVMGPASDLHVVSSGGYSLVHFTLCFVSTSNQRLTGLMTLGPYL